MSVLKPTQSTHSSISIKIDSSYLTFPILSCFRVSEVKQSIQKLTNIPISDQRLYYGHIELQNPRSLEDYDLFEKSRKTRSLILEYSRISGCFVRPVPGSFCTRFLQGLINSVNQGLRMNLAPQLTWDGTGGTYLLKDSYKKIRAVFKPIDEEPFAPMNPRGYIGKLNGTGIRGGILSGTSAYREVAAYLLDHSHFSSVPETGLVESLHPTYKYNINENSYSKKGSLQEFVENNGSIEDFSISLFSKTEVQKIAILDIRILNMDRNVANVLVDGSKRLRPIDHGLSFPDSLGINEYDLCWMDFQQCKEIIDEACLDYIANLDVLKDLTFLKENFNFDDKTLTNVRISGILLKKGALAGLTLNQIGSLLYRKEYENTASIIEQVVLKSIEFCKTITQSLTSRLILEKNLYLKNNKRGRANSSHAEIDLIHFSDIDSTTYSSNSEDTCEVFLTIREVEEEYEEEISAKDCNGRSISLPCLAGLEKINKREKNLAFDNKLFYYIEAFIDLAIDKKIRDINKLMNPNGRMRSVSDAAGFSDDFDYSLYR